MQPIASTLTFDLALTTCIIWVALALEMDVARELLWLERLTLVTTSCLRLLVLSTMPLHELIIIDWLVNAMLFLLLIWPYTVTAVRPRTRRTLVRTLVLLIQLLCLVRWRGFLLFWWLRLRLVFPWWYPLHLLLRFRVWLVLRRVPEKRDSCDGPDET